MCKLFPRGLVLISFFVGTASVHAVSTNLLAVSDTYLRDELSSDDNFGNSEVVLVGVSLDATKHNHGLFRFSLFGIPANATITGATLHLISTGGMTAPFNHGLHRLLKDWNESEATWNLRLLPSTGWGAGGGKADDDFLSAPSAIAAIDIAPTTNDFSSSGMVADVQLWVSDPDTNFGWMVIAVDGQLGSGKILGSRESLAAQPYLTVDYTLPSAPGAAMIQNVGLIENQFIFSFNGESNHTYAVEFRDSFSSGSWDPLTNIPVLPADTTLYITNAISSGQRYFRIRTL
jgi:hypothetical protein